MSNRNWQPNQLSEGASPLPAAEASAPRRVEKPWGHEIIWAETERYVGKILHVMAGHSLSLQYHERKDETLFLASGRVRLEVGESESHLRTTPFRVGDRIRLAAGTLHRIEALEDSDILEVSTPELDDVVRIKDRYGRG